MTQYRERRERGESREYRERGEPREYRGRRKRCRLCTGKVAHIDYKDVAMLRNFTNDRGKILPRRAMGNCARHQRLVTRAIKRARNIAFLPFTQH